MAMATIKCIYFAQIRELIGRSEEIIEIPEGVLTPVELITALKTQNGTYAAAFSDLARIKCALDQTMSSLDTPIGEAREIAFFPPVTGG
jgi:sulfur-carrier protein